jgi:hypothetical protein
MQRAKLAAAPRARVTAGSVIVLAAVGVPAGAGDRKKSRQFAVARRYIRPSYLSDARDYHLVGKPIHLRGHHAGSGAGFRRGAP